MQGAIQSSGRTRIVPDQPPSFDSNIAVQQLFCRFVNPKRFAVPVDQHYRFAADLERLQRPRSSSRPEGTRQRSTCRQSVRQSRKLSFLCFGEGTLINRTLDRETPNVFSTGYSDPRKPTQALRRKKFLVVRVLFYPVKT